MYIDTMGKNSVEAVDLKYKVLTDEDSGVLYVKFTGFEGKEQLEQFAEYLTNHLPLLLFNSDTEH